MEHRTNKTKGVGGREYKSSNALLQILRDAGPKREGSPLFIPEISGPWGLGNAKPPSHPPGPGLPIAPSQAGAKVGGNEERPGTL